MSGNYGWCQSCGALVFGSSQCHKCDGKVKEFCVDIQLVKFRDENKAIIRRAEAAESDWQLAEERIKELEVELANEKSVAAKSYTAYGNYQTEIQEVANQLLDLYHDCNETTEPKVYGTILGLHERLEIFLKDKRDVN